MTTGSGAEMHVGVALQCAGGIGGFDCDTTYHLLANTKESIALVFFTKGSSEWRAHIIKVPRHDFEEALIKKDLIPVLEQPTLPPWLRMHEGASLDTLDHGRTSTKKSYRDWAQDRYERIDELVDDPNLVLADDPEKYIASFATRNKQHRHRIQLWYCAYMCFGRSLMALVPTFANAGSWDRTEENRSRRKAGRKAKHGRGQGHSAVPLIPEVENSYVKYSGLGKSMAWIHRQSLLYAFGCKIARDSKGFERYYHPESKPFPSYQQFRYHVLKKFGLPAVRKSKLGDETYRNRVADNLGRYSEDLANLYEQSESDCAYSKERPRQILSDEAGPPFAVVREVDVLSGIEIGIGFGYGSETLEAYRAAKFCAAVPKSYFCRLFGIQISDEDWPCVGLPPQSSTDRGPGASGRNVRTENIPAIRGLAPSYSGQSKATVESSHPRQTRTAGPPSFVVSALNAFEMARREIYRTLANNNAKDASDRLTPEMIAAGTLPTPVGIFNFLNDRGRTSAVPMSVTAAIREFLTPVKFKLNRDGLWLRSLRYGTTQLQALGLASLAGKNRTIEVSGFVLSLAIRIAWIEVDGKIYEVEAILPIRDDATQLDMSLSDLSQLDERMREIRANQSDHASAVRAKYEIRHLEETGRHWDAATRKGGQPPSNASVRESLDVVNTPKSGRAA